MAVMRMVRFFDVLMYADNFFLFSSTLDLRTLVYSSMWGGDAIAGYNL
jgi:hypothetical protein